MSNMIESLKEELFGTMKLHKKSTVSHRIAGSLSSGGSRDYLPSITNWMKTTDSHERTFGNGEIDDVESAWQRGGTKGD